jgi:hypothetical protein
MDPDVRCHEVAFADAICRIQVSQIAAPAGLPGYSAQMFRLGSGRREMHQLISRDGQPLEVRGRTETAALITAIAYLAERYGGLTEYAHACEDFGDAPSLGTPCPVPDTA